MHRPRKIPFLTWNAIFWIFGFLHDAKITISKWTQALIDEQCKN
jgi:hypothetical protein